MKRSNIQRRTPLRPVSVKRRSIAEQRRQLVTRLLLRYPLCQVEGCRRESQHVHEKLTRGRGGSILDESNCMAVCPQHHRWIHDHPNDATELGLLVASWSRQPAKPAPPDPTPRIGADLLAGGDHERERLEERFIHELGERPAMFLAADPDFTVWNAWPFVRRLSGVLQETTAEEV